jgi:peptidoglycan L-alanyl-D-glutamate endopeptidase CwlK
MTFYLSRASLSKLQGVHPDLVKVVKRAIEITPVDFKITCGLRTQIEQAALYAQGRTKPGKIVTWTMNSQHLIQASGYGHAIDVAALDGGEITWDWPHYEAIADAMRRAAEELDVAITWGGTFTRRDGAHFQLDTKVYR